MGNLNNAIALSGFATLPNAIYYNKYKTTIGLKDDATNADGTNGWYSDSDKFVIVTNPWFGRGIVLTSMIVQVCLLLPTMLVMPIPTLHLVPLSSPTKTLLHNK